MRDSGYFPTIEVSRYKEMVAKLAKDLPVADALTHFGCGMIVEYGEFVEERDTKRVEDWNKVDREWRQVDELGDILFYAYAFCGKLVELSRQCSLDPDYWSARMVVQTDECLNRVGDLVRSADNTDFHYLGFTRRKLPGEDVGITALVKPLDMVMKWRYHNAHLKVGDLALALDTAICVAYSAAVWTGVSFKNIMAINFEKLTKRHPDGFRGVGWKNDGGGK